MALVAQEGRPLNFWGRLLTLKALRQLVLYGAVSGVEYAVGAPSYVLLTGLGVSGFWAFTYTQAPIGLMGFLLRKFAVFGA